MELTEQNISDMLEKVPTFSQSVVRILELTGDINSSTRELVTQVTNDPILSANVLKLVNSAYFGLSREVTSIQQSVVYVGINTIKNLAISIAAMGALPKTSKAGLDMSRFWLHSLVTASAAKLLARRQGVNQTDVSKYFISGLLHDIGKLIFSEGAPEAYREVITRREAGDMSFTELEEDVFGVTHAGIGALLAEKWQLPADIVAALRYHHSSTFWEGDQSLNFTIYIANLIGNNFNNDGEFTLREPLPEDIQAWLGAPLDQVVASMDTLKDEIDNARLFIQLGA